MSKILEPVLAIGIHKSSDRRFDSEESFSELKSLITTAGGGIVKEVIAELRQIAPATFLGKGKIDEILIQVQLLKPSLIVVDADLSPTQTRNMEEIWKTRVLDRTGLILDIFAKRARSKEGKLQVELAQYQYLFPRLIRAWTHLTNQRGGGIGLRGPGETQLEVDRRRIRDRMTFLKKDLIKVSQTRDLHRQRRKAIPLPTISLIGYTNAGKSTLFNHLVPAQVKAEDQLFTTLDPTTRRLQLLSGQNILVSDTVGFIKNLPHQLVEAFKSTFEEVAASDLLVHVIDVSHPNRLERIKTVDLVLKELSLDQIPMVRVFNKVDQLENDFEDWHDGMSVADREHSVQISALHKQGLDALLHKIESMLGQTFYRRMHLLIPYTQGRAVSDLYTYGTVFSHKDGETGSEIEVNLPEKWQNIYRHFEVNRSLF